MKNKKIALTLVSALIIISGLAVALGFAVQAQNNFRNELENLYQKSYYDAVASISDIEVRLSKLSVTESKSGQVALLEDIWRQTELAEVNLSQLGSRDSESENIIKFVNQLGDYCHYLAKKVKTDGLAESDSKNLEQLASIILSLQKELYTVNNHLSDGKKLMSKFSSKGLNFLNDLFVNFNQSSVEYPEMIYDGPFSDGLNDRDVKFLKDKAEVTKEQAEQKAKEYLSGHNNLKLKFETELKGNIECYQFSVDSDKGNGYIQMTKKGGYIFLMDIYKEVTNPVLTEDECMEKGKEFIKKLGFDTMECVWVSNHHSTIYLNFACKDGDIVEYPDLVKLKISAEDGSIIGVEAKNYLYNHCKRTFEATKAVSLAEAKVSKNITVLTRALTLIPTDYNKEILCYEFSGRYNDNLFYVYIDAVTLEEIKVMKVIDDEGKLIV